MKPSPQIVAGRYIAHLLMLAAALFLGHSRGYAADFGLKTCIWLGAREEIADMAVFGGHIYTCDTVNRSLAMRDEETGDVVKSLAINPAHIAASAWLKRVFVVNRVGPGDTSLEVYDENLNLKGLVVGWEHWGGIFGSGEVLGIQAYNGDELWILYRAMTYMDASLVRLRMADPCDGRAQVLDAWSGIEVESGTKFNIQTYWETVDYLGTEFGGEITYFTYAGAKYCNGYQYYRAPICITPDQAYGKVLSDNKDLVERALNSGIEGLQLKFDDTPRILLPVNDRWAVKAGGAASAAMCGAGAGYVFLSECSPQGTKWLEIGDTATDRVEFDISVGVGGIQCDMRMFSHYVTEARFSREGEGEGEIGEEAYRLCQYDLDHVFLFDHGMRQGSLAPRIQVFTTCSGDNGVDCTDRRALKEEYAYADDFIELPGTLGGMGTDAEDSLYIGVNSAAGWGMHVIKYDRDGFIAGSYAGWPANRGSVFTAVKDIAVDHANGLVYAVVTLTVPAHIDPRTCEIDQMSDVSYDTLAVFDSDLRPVRLPQGAFDSAPAIDWYKTGKYRSVAVDPEGNVYLYGKKKPGARDNRIYAYTGDGDYLTEWECPRLIGDLYDDGDHIAVGPAGRSIFLHTRVYAIRYDFDGNLLQVWQRSGTGAAAIDLFDDLYECDPSLIRKRTDKGRSVCSIGNGAGDGDGQAERGFDGVAAYCGDTVYAADSLYPDIRVEAFKRSWVERPMMEIIPTPQPPMIYHPVYPAPWQPSYEAPYSPPRSSMEYPRLYPVWPDLWMDAVKPPRGMTGRMFPPYQASAPTTTALRSGATATTAGTAYGAAGFTEASAYAGAGYLRGKGMLAGEAKVSPAVGPDGTAYVGMDDGRFYAIGPSGNIRWVFSTDGAAQFAAYPAQFTSALVGPDGTVYVGVDHGTNHQLYALYASGGLKWKASSLAGMRCFASPGLAMSRPAGTLYFATRAELVAVNAATGQSAVRYRWARTLWPDNSNYRSSPAVDESGTVYVCAGHTLYAVWPTGGLKWMAQTMDWGRDLLAVTPVLRGEEIYAVAGFQGERVYCFARATGAVRWVFTSDTRAQTASSPVDLETAWLYSAPVGVGADGTVYLGADKLYAIGAYGTRRWAYAPAVRVNGTSYAAELYTTPLCLADGSVCAAGWETGTLFGVDAYGRMKWVFRADAGKRYAAGEGVRGDMYGNVYYAASALDSYATTALYVIGGQAPAVSAMSAGASIATVAYPTPTPTPVPTTSGTTASATATASTAPGTSFTASAVSVLR